MKLKKIASLMLAGVMAVSMLAGCSGNTTNGNESGTVVPETTSIVAAVNNGQSADNKVKIDFTSSTSLDANLAKAVKAIGEYFAPMSLNVQMGRLTGIEIGMEDIIDNNDGKHDELIKQDGVKYERVIALPVMNVYADKAAAEKAVAKYIDEEIVSKLDDTTLTKDTKYDTKYADMSYAGSVSMVSITENDGTVNYYFAVVITQTINVKTLKPAA